MVVLNAVLSAAALARYYVASINCYFIIRISVVIPNERLTVWASTHVAEAAGHRPCEYNVTGQTEKMNPVKLSMLLPICLKPPLQLGLKANLMFLYNLVDSVIVETKKRIRPT
jgi:hypothetical protein